MIKNRIGSADTVFAVFGGQNRGETKINQSICVFVGAKNNASTATAITTIWAAFGNINFMAERNGTVAAFTSL